MRLSSLDAAGAGKCTVFTAPKQRKYAAARLARGKPRVGVEACLKCIQRGSSRAWGTTNQRTSGCDLLVLGATPNEDNRTSPKLGPVDMTRNAADGKDSDSDSDEAPPGEETLGVKMALGLLRFYKAEISPILPASCRYFPTCSVYAMESYKKFGVWKGTVLTAWRLARCSPFGSSGYDPPKWPPPGMEWLGEK